MKIFWNTGGIAFKSSEAWSGAICSGVAKNQSLGVGHIIRVEVLLFTYWNNSWCQLQTIAVLSNPNTWWHNKAFGIGLSMGVQHIRDEITAIEKTVRPITLYHYPMCVAWAISKLLMNRIPPRAVWLCGPFAIRRAALFANRENVLPHAALAFLKSILRNLCAFFFSLSLSLSLLLLPFSPRRVQPHLLDTVFRRILVVVFVGRGHNRWFGTATCAGRTETKPVSMTLHVSLLCELRNLPPPTSTPPPYPCVACK